MDAARKHYWFGLLAGTGMGMILARLAVYLGWWDFGAANFGPVGAAALLAVVAGSFLQSRSAGRAQAAPGADPGAAAGGG